MAEEVEIEMNMLRERAEKSPPITDEMWAQCNELNRFVVEEFIEANQNLSKDTLKVYKSGFRIFFWYAKIKLRDKPTNKIN